MTLRRTAIPRPARKARELGFCGRFKLTSRPANPTTTPIRPWQAARALTVQTTGIRAFRFRFVQGGEVFGEAMGERLPPKPGLTPLRLVAGLRSERVVVPEAVAITAPVQMYKLHWVGV